MGYLYQAMSFEFKFVLFLFLGCACLFYVIKLWKNKAQHRFFIFLSSCCFLLLFYEISKEYGWGEKISNIIFIVFAADLLVGAIVLGIYGKLKQNKNKIQTSNKRQRYRRNR